MNITFPKPSIPQVWLLAAALLVVAAFFAAFLPADFAAGEESDSPRLLASAADGVFLYLVYDRELDAGSTPTNDAFIVRINDNEATVNSVSISGRWVKLTLADAAQGSDAVTVSYQLQGDPLRAAGGGDAPAFSAQATQNLHSGGAPHAPQDVGLSRNDRNDQLVVSWQAPADTTTVHIWQIECDTSSSFGSTDSVTQALDASGAYAFTADERYSHTCANLNTDTRYYARARAFNGSGVGPWAEASDFLSTSSVVTISPNSDSITEGEDAAFTVTLHPVPSESTQVTVEVSRVSGDYGITDGSTHTVTVGDDGAGTLSLSTTDDNVEEEDGSVTVRVHPAPSDYAKGNPNEVSLAIRDNDAIPTPTATSVPPTRQPIVPTSTPVPTATPVPPTKQPIVPTATPVPPTKQITVPSATVAAASAAITEGGNAVFTVTLNPAPSSSVAVTYNVTVAGDYGVSAASSQTVTVNAGSTTGTITLATTDDSVDEANGSVTVTLATGTGYSVGTAKSASVTVNDNDDPTATVAATSAAITEGGSAVFTVTLSRPQSSNVSVNYNLALAGEYGVTVPNNTTVTVNSGSTTGTVTFATTDDSDDELDGSITVALAAGAGYGVGVPNSATVTVNDNDEPATANQITTAVCNRSPAIRDALVSATGNTACGNVTEPQLARIDTLEIRGVATVASGDFDDLPNLRWMYLEGTGNTTSLPDDIFDGNTKLLLLFLNKHGLTSVQSDLFEELTGLQRLVLHDNNLGTLPADLFNDLPNLRLLDLRSNGLTSVDENLFDGLTNLQMLLLNSNKLTSLHVNTFDGLTKLHELHLRNNSLTSLPEDIFDGLNNLWLLSLINNDLNTLSNGHFNELSSLEKLYLVQNPGVPFGLSLPGVRIYE